MLLSRRSIRFLCTAAMQYSPETATKAAKKIPFTKNGSLVYSLEESETEGTLGIAAGNKAKKDREKTNITVWRSLADSTFKGVLEFTGISNNVATFRAVGPLLFKQEELKAKEEDMKKRSKAKAAAVAVAEDVGDENADENNNNNNNNAQQQQQAPLVRLKNSKLRRVLDSCLTTFRRSGNFAPPEFPMRAAEFKTIFSTNPGLVINGGKIFGKWGVSVRSGTFSIKLLAPLAPSISTTNTLEVAAINPQVLATVAALPKRSSSSSSSSSSSGGSKQSKAKTSTNSRRSASTTSSKKKTSSSKSTASTSSKTAPKRKVVTV